jgi:hypothetical protein
MKQIPKDNKGLAKLPKPVRNKMGYMARGGKTKGYAYGSMVRSPMASENKMQTSMNPMQPREQAGMQPPVDKKMAGMMYGGKAKKKNGY